MTFEEIAQYESARKHHGADIADRAYSVLSVRNIDKHGVERAWTIAVRTVLEADRFYDHGTGAVRPRFRSL
jgi:hypothetical protein